MDSDVFTATPAGSLVNVAEQERMRYIRELRKLPPALLNLATSVKVGSYIRGLIKTYNLPSTSEELVALIVFQILIGDFKLVNAASLLSSKLRLANDKAQKIAQEIERDLLAPVALELNQHLSQKKRQSGSMAEKLSMTTPTPTTPPFSQPSRPPAPPKFPRRPATPPNILNLKDQKKPPQPPFIP